MVSSPTSRGAVHEQSLANEDEDDDYMTMTFSEPALDSKAETLTQRKKRLAREAEERGRTKSKAQLAEEGKAKREAALNKSSIMETSSKGFKMMAALGYKLGTALGRAREVDRAVQAGDGQQVETRLLEPIGLEIREGKSGIGADAEKKRKIREAFEQQEHVDKKQKVGEGDFRERKQRDREEKKIEGQIWGAMKVAERLEEEGDPPERPKEKRSSSKPLSAVNVLWRGLVKDRALKERDRRMRYDLNQSLSRLPTYDDPDEEKEDKFAMGKKDMVEEIDLDLDQEDSELDEFESLDIGEKLNKLVVYLRSTWNYCFWCKYRYPDAEMDGCPGPAEDDHD